MCIIRVTWIYSYVSAKETFIKQVIMDHLKIQVQVICCWHRAHRRLLGPFYNIDSYDKNELYVTQ